tara:strand:+ start:281 stop:979 length:699 start_codon:yes stop_codon:yes gene_type:complete
MERKSGIKKIKRIAKRYDLSMDEAKQFYLDRKEAVMEGRELPFYKWKKRNLNFDDTMEGNDIETGDFDNFFSRKRRKKIARAIRKSVPRPIRRADARVKGLIGGGISRTKDLIKRRRRKIRLNKKLLSKLRDPRFLANPSNAKKVRIRVKNMAKQIAKMDRQLVNRARRNVEAKAEMIDNLGFDGGTYYGDFNASGSGKKQNFFQKNKMLIIGAGIVFLFFTPMGKKLISKK